MISSDEKEFSQLIQNYFITLYPYPNLENHLYSESFVSEKKHLLFFKCFLWRTKAWGPLCERQCGVIEFVLILVPYEPAPLLWWLFDVSTLLQYPDIRQTLI